MIQRFRVPLGFAVAFMVFYVATPTAASLAAGLPIAVAGAILRGLAAGVIRKDSKLAVFGPYAWTRNPLYFGSTLLAIGFAVMSFSWVAAALLLVPSAIIYPNVIRNEEAHLERLFGEEFRAYCRSVPAFFPKPAAGRLFFSLEQYRANREYNTALGLAGAVLLLVVRWYQLTR